MPDFLIEFQNARTNWLWKEAPWLADIDSNGVEFADEFIVPDITDKHRFFSWTNFRLYCPIGLDKINLWASYHDRPNQLDLSGRAHQSGDAISTYSDYETLSGLFKNSNRLYIWIGATNKDASYANSQTIYDSKMNKAVSLRDLSPTQDLASIASWLGWDPDSNPNGAAPYNFSVSGSSKDFDIARYIVGWDNSCCNVLTSVINPAVGFEYQASIMDTYKSIDGMTGKQWLGCGAEKYVYGKLVYSLEDHDSPGELLLGNYGNYKLNQTSGFKSFQLNLAGVSY